jgi:hypothetical protein
LHHTISNSASRKAVALIGGILTFDLQLRSNNRQKWSLNVKKTKEINIWKEAFHFLLNKKILIAKFHLLKPQLNLLERKKTSQAEVFFQPISKV